MRVKIQNSNAGSPNTPTRVEGTVTDFYGWAGVRWRLAPIGPVWAAPYWPGVGGPGSAKFF